MEQAPQSPHKCSHKSYDRRNGDRRRTSVDSDERRHEDRRTSNLEGSGRRHEERRKKSCQGYMYLSMVGWYCRRERCGRKGDSFE